MRWLRLALADIEELHEWLEKNVDQATAIMVSQRIWDSAKTLSRFPFRCRKGRAAGTREMDVPKTSYFIVYRVQNDEVQILRVINFSRNYTGGLPLSPSPLL